MRKLEAAVLRSLAVRGGVDERTIAKVYAGQPVRGLARHRAIAALKEAGFTPGLRVVSAAGGQS